MRRTHIVLLVLGFLYLLFPTANSTIDAYDYAASIKWGIDLFSSHHLLYNATGWLFHQIAPLDALLLMKVLNAAVALLAISLVGKIIARLNGDTDPAPWMLLAGVSFGIWRFATENETYIVPLALSLAGSLYMLRASSSGKWRDYLLSGVFAAVACLYHQLHFFWWIGLFAASLMQDKQKWLRNGLWFGAAAILVPAAYILVLITYEGKALTLDNLMHLVFRDFYAGRVETTLKPTHFILSAINLVRTFLQVHGNIYYMLARDITLAVPFLVAAYFLVRALATGAFRAVAKYPGGLYRNIHLGILALHLGYAFFSEGNAEFMIMAPVILAILVATPIPDTRSLYLLGLSMMAWNFSYGIFPAFHYDLHKHGRIADRVVAEPDALFILEHKVHVDNIIFYHTKEYPSNTQKSPHDLAMMGKSPDSLSLAITSYGTVYTDLVASDNALDRKTILKGSDNQTFFNDYTTEEVDSFNTLMGMRRLTEVKRSRSLP